MDKESMQPRIYRISPIRQGAMIGACAIIMGPLIISAWFTDNSVLLIVTVIVAAVFILFLWFFGYYPSLTFSRAGIELNYIGCHLKAPWNNVANLWQEQGSEGFLLHNPMTEPGAARLARSTNFRFAGTSFYGSSQRQQWINEQRFIPIEPFAWWLHHGNLQQDLRAFTPWIEAMSLQPTKKKNLPVGRKIFVVTIILSALALGLLLAANLIPPNVERLVYRTIAVLMIVGISVYILLNVVHMVNHIRTKNLNASLLTALFILAQLFAILVIINYIVM